MLWLIAGLIQAFFIAVGIRQDEKAGVWSWSKFFFALAFAGLEITILIVPLTWADPHGPHARYFIPVLVASCIIAALNFVWFIIVCRRWRLPDGRTSLQAYRDERQ